jgi:hypothetical protein
MSSIPIPGAAICPTCTRAGRAHAPGRDRDGVLLHTGELVRVIGEGWGLFITPAADGSEDVFVWLLASRELAVRPKGQVARALSAIQD